MKNFLDIKDISADDLNKILDLALKIKANPENYYNALAHKKMILLLEIKLYIYLVFIIIMHNVLKSGLIHLINVHCVILK